MRDETRDALLIAVAEWLWITAKWSTATNHPDEFEKLRGLLARAKLEIQKAPDV